MQVTILKPHIECVDEAVETGGASGQFEDPSPVLLCVGADCHHLLDAGQERVGGHHTTQLRLRAHLYWDVSYRTAQNWDSVNYQDMNREERCEIR